jgi:acyl carrier protein
MPRTDTAWEHERADVFSSRTDARSGRAGLRHPDASFEAGSALPHRPQSLLGWLDSDVDASGVPAYGAPPEYPAAPQKSDATGLAEHLGPQYLRSVTATGKSFDHRGCDRLLGLVHAQGHENATKDDDLLALGFTSLQILRLITDIEREFGISVDLGVVLNAPTIGDLAEQLLGGDQDT